MKKKLLLALFVMASGFSFAQPEQINCNAPNAGEFLHGNNVRAYISSGGSLFFDGDDASFQGFHSDPPVL